MFISFIRTFILYISLNLIMRLMGKRQIGQLQPGELVITILISEIAAIPMQDNDIPLINSFISILVLTSLEIMISCISLKSIRFRSLIQGHSIVIIKDGKIDLKQLTRVRYSIDDILEALRKKNIFDITDVQYAIVETDGMLSVMLKDGKLPVNKEDLNLPEKDNSMPFTVISDGRIIESNLPECNLTKEKLLTLVKNQNLNIKNILLMTATKTGKTSVTERENKK